jgi:hypothetical protein
MSAKEVAVDGCSMSTEDLSQKANPHVVLGDVETE